MRGQGPEVPEKLDGLQGPAWCTTGVCRLIANRPWAAACHPVPTDSSKGNLPGHPLASGESELGSLTGMLGSSLSVTSLMCDPEHVPCLTV